MEAGAGAEKLQRFTEYVQKVTEGGRAKGKNPETSSKERTER